MKYNFWVLERERERERERVEWRCIYRGLLAFAIPQSSFPTPKKKGGRRKLEIAMADPYLLYDFETHTLKMPTKHFI